MFVRPQRSAGTWPSSATIRHRMTHFTSLSRREASRRATTFWAIFHALLAPEQIPRKSFATLRTSCCNLSLRDRECACTGNKITSWRRLRAFPRHCGPENTQPPPGN